MATSQWETGMVHGNGIRGTYDCPCLTQTCRQDFLTAQTAPGFLNIYPHPLSIHSCTHCFPLRKASHCTRWLPGMPVRNWLKVPVWMRVYVLCMSVRQRLEISSIWQRWGQTEGTRELSIHLLSSTLVEGKTSAGVQLSIGGKLQHLHDLLEVLRKQKPTSCEGVKKKTYSNYVRGSHGFDAAKGKHIDPQSAEIPKQVVWTRARGILMLCIRVRKKGDQ